jgi:hypothetical protein
MHADFEENVANGAQDLNDQSTQDDTKGIARHTHIVHEIEQYGIADYRDDVGHKAAFALSHLVMCPTVDLAIKIDAQPWCSNGQQIHQR